MSLIIYFFFFLLLIIAFFILSVGISVLKIFRKKPSGGQFYNHDSRQGGYNTGSADSPPGHSHKKVFDKDEGEYVDYEEIE